MDKSGNTFDNSIGSSSISDFLRFSSNFAVIKLLLVFCLDVDLQITHLSQSMDMIISFVPNLFAVIGESEEEKGLMEKHVKELKQSLVDLINQVRIMCQYDILREKLFVNYPTFSLQFLSCGNGRMSPEVGGN